MHQWIKRNSLFWNNTKPLSAICYKEFLLNHYDNPVWSNSNNFWRKIQGFFNYWHWVSNRLPLFIIKSFHILLIKFYSFYLDLKSYLKYLENWSQNSTKCNKQCSKNSFKQIGRVVTYISRFIYDLSFISFFQF